MWALIEKAPSPSERAKLTRASIDAILERHRIRRLTSEGVQAVLRRDLLSLRSVYIESYVARALVLIERLKLARARIVKVEKQIRTTFAERVKSEEQAERAGPERGAWPWATILPCRDSDL